MTSRFYRNILSTCIQDKSSRIIEWHKMRTKNALLEKVSRKFWDGPVSIKVLSPMDFELHLLKSKILENKQELRMSAALVIRNSDSTLFEVQ